VRSFELLAAAWGLTADVPHTAYDLVPSGA
jgi:hypothetical protein